MTVNPFPKRAPMSAAPPSPPAVSSADRPHHQHGRRVVGASVDAWRRLLDRLDRSDDPTECLCDAPDLHAVPGWPSAWECHSCHRPWLWVTDNHKEPW